VADFRADPDHLRSVAPRFEQLSGDVSSALAKLAQGLDAEGKCWGSDAPGQQFEKGYSDASVENMKAQLETFSDNLKAAADKITAVADGLQQQDERNAQPIAQQTKNL
jgi:WXG100 family type VII secretion target